jgi:iron complex outermembrane receptor protein
MGVLRALSMVMVALISAVPVFGQDERGRLQGSIVDATGAPLPGVTVTLQNDARGVAVTRQTGGDGRYVFDVVEPGNYTITAELSGFTTDVQENVQVPPGGDVTVDVMLQLSDVAEEVVVRGFRSSLEQSVDLKRAAVNVRESIVAQDIGKMPDLNLAEAIQRVPGVAIVREGGEGRQISLRGLGANFTRVTLNGMEVPASAGGLDSFGGLNRGRAFDFNVFSAELFSRIDVSKTSTAAIEEGGIAGAVELYTPRPLSDPGLRASVSVQGGYNDVSEGTDPRITGILSTTNEAETFGFVVSGAYAGRTPFQDGFGTVRWAQPDRPFAGNNTDLGDADLHSLWFPRLPRQDSFRHDQDRVGFTTGLQLRPTSGFEASVNWVHSRFQATTESYNSFAQFRRSGDWGYPAITPNAVTVRSDGTGQYAVAGNFDGVALRTESRQNVDETLFNQITVDFRRDFGSRLTLTGMVGHARSEYVDDYFRVNIETPNATNFSYDFTANPDVAMIDYEIDVTDPSNFFIQDNERIERNTVDRKNNTVRLDLEWAVDGGHVVRLGGIYNDREVDSVLAEHDGAPPGDLRGISKVFPFIDAGGFDNRTELDFLALDFERSKAAYGVDFGSFPVVRGPGRPTWLVEEQTAGAYVDYTLTTLLDGRAFRANLGTRFVNTTTDATGWLAQDIPNTESNSYNNLLPALNIAFDATDDLVLRAAVGRSLTRPSLASLAPIKGYSDVNFTVSGGNSQLEPLKADAVDLSAEWYFAGQGVAAVGVFYKDIKSFISSPSTEGPLRPEDRPAVTAVYPTQPELLDPSLIWTYSTATNVDGTSLKGVELAYQQPFTFLPGRWSNLGFVGNYSYVDAKTRVERSGAMVEVPLEGMSKHSFNATLYYETDVFGVRLSLNSRSNYVTDNTGSNGNISHATTGPIRLDLSALYHITDAVSLTLEGVNLTNEYERLFTTGDGTMDLVREYNTTGRQFYAGLRLGL